MYGIFLEHHLETEEDFDVVLLGNRFDDLATAVKRLEDLASLHGGTVGEDLSDDDIEFYWAVAERDLPYGYKSLVYYVGKISDYDLEHYAI